MAQTVYLTFEHPDSTWDFNQQFADIIANGAYKGLTVLATDVPSLKLNIDKGNALTIEGVKISESILVPEAVEVIAGHPTRRRIDLVCMYHQYIAAETIPSGNPATYHVIEGEVPADDVTPPVAPYDKLSKYHIPLSEIHVPAGATFITSDMIFNTRRIQTTKELSDETAKLLYYTFGNFSYEGWDVSDGGVLTVIVSPGSGALCGRLNISEENGVVNNLRPREFLRPINDPNTGDAYQVGPNLSLLEQPDFPTKLRVTIESPTCAVAGNIYISGRNDQGDQLLNHKLEVAQSSGEVITYETDVYFGEVFLEGIDAHELVCAGHDVFIHIKDKPEHKIYAVGTDIGRPIFRAELDPSYQPKCNELLLGIIETDETGIINVDDLDTNPLAEYADHLSPQCDGARKIFHAQSIPAPSSDTLWLDGIQLMKDETADWAQTFGKGYKLNGTEVVLGPNVTAPDTNTVLVLKYKRHN